MCLDFRTDGVGLSAPQVGVNVQLMVYNPEGERGKGQEYVLVNPKIVKYGRKTEDFVEGCLSFPTIEASVEVASKAGCVAFCEYGGTLKTCPRRCEFIRWWACRDR